MDFAAINHCFNTEHSTTPLSAEEEQELIHHFKRGDVIARRRLIESNIRFVVKMAMNYRNQGLALADLIQEGNLGLIEALEKYDPSKTCRLITYASWWIRLYMQRAIEQKSRQVNLPINKLDLLRKTKAFEKSFEMIHGRKPTTEEIAQALSVEKDKIIDLQDVIPTFQTIHGLDEEHPGMEKVLEDDRHPDPREILWLNEVKNRLLSAMKVLNSRERQVIAHRFGLEDDEKKLSLRKVGQLMGLSAEGVRRIEEQAMSKLRRPMVLARMESLLAG